MPPSEVPGHTCDGCDVKPDVTLHPEPPDALGNLGDSTLEAALASLQATR